MAKKVVTNKEIGKNTPKFLYQYQKFNKNSKSNLIMNRFYFSKPARFNDPFDSNTNFVLIDQEEKEIKIAFDRVRKGILDNLGSKFDAVKFDTTFLTNGRPNKEFEDYLINSPYAASETGLSSRSMA